QLRHSDGPSDLLALWIVLRLRRAPPAARLAHALLRAGETLEARLTALLWGFFRSGSIPIEERARAPAPLPRALGGLGNVARASSLPQFFGLSGVHVELLAVVGLVGQLIALIGDDQHWSRADGADGAHGADVGELGAGDALRPEDDELRERE